MKLVRTNRIVRSAAFAYALLPIGFYLWEREAGPVAWTLSVLQFLVYPQLVYWRAMLSARPSRAELDNLFLDSLLLGAWVAGLGFPAWIAYSLLSAAMLNAAVNRGASGALLSLGASAVGAAVAASVGGLSVHPETSNLVSALCAAGSLAYTSGVGFVVWAQNRGLAAARDEVKKSEERYRLIAENADDLVAMIDEQGRWIYSSPSYKRVLPAADLAPGADAFAHLHPDDAERARKAVARAAASAKPRELTLRLVDAGGRVRQYRAHVQAVGDGRPPYNVLLVSHDITDLKESEEKVLLAAHALEGMTEAIMITAADGTVLTVNRAFTELTGLERDEVLGQSEKAIRTGLQPPEFYDTVYGEVLRNGYWSGTKWNRRKNGVVYREWRSVRSVKDSTGAVTHFVHVFYEAGAGRSSAGAGNPLGA